MSDDDWTFRKIEGNDIFTLKTCFAQTKEYKPEVRDALVQIKKLMRVNGISKVEI